MKVFATADIGPAALDLLRQAGYELEVYPGPEAPPYELLLAQTASGIDGLITTLRDRVDAGLLAAGHGHLRVVAQDAVGVDNIDLAAASRLGIPVTHTPGVLTQATAEFALFMLGALARRLWASENLVRERQWGAWHPALPFLGSEVTGKTVAVVGLGRIGRAFAQKCVGLDMNLLACGRSPQPEWIAAVQREMDLRHELGFSRHRARIQAASLREALGAADFVSLHVPLIRPGDPAAGADGANVTYHLLNRQTLAWMRPTAYLINTARGPVLDEAALIEALRQNQLAGAALDVYATEPLPGDSPLRAEDLAGRLRLYHHFASGTVETRLSPDPEQGMAGRCVAGLRNVLEGRYAGRLAQMPWLANRSAFQK